MTALVLVLIVALLISAAGRARSVGRTATSPAVDSWVSEQDTHRPGYRRVLRTAAGVTLALAATVAGVALAFVSVFTAALAGLAFLWTSHQPVVHAVGVAGTYFVLLLAYSFPGMGALVAHVWFTPRPVDRRWTRGRIAYVGWAGLVGLASAVALGIGGWTLVLDLHAPMIATPSLDRVIGALLILASCAAPGIGPLLVFRFRRTTPPLVLTTVLGVATLCVGIVIALKQL